MFGDTDICVRLQQIGRFAFVLLSTTEAGRLMARYCVAFDTMKQFSKVDGSESLSDLVCHWFPHRLHLLDLLPSQSSASLLVPVFHYLK